MSTNKARRNERGTRSAVATLTLDDYARLRVLAARLGLSTELTTEKLILAAVDAFEECEEFTWPLYLKPTSNAEEAAQYKARQLAEGQRDRAIISMS